MKSFNTTIFTKACIHDSFKFEFTKMNFMNLTLIHLNPKKVKLNKEKPRPWFTSFVKLNFTDRA